LRSDMSERRYDSYLGLVPSRPARLQARRPNTAPIVDQAAAREAALQLYGKVQNGHCAARA